MDKKFDERRPLGVEDKNWYLNSQIGAVYGRVLYPSFIDLIPNIVFITQVRGDPVFIYIVKHARALEVTDYKNELFLSRENEKNISRIRNQILDVDFDNISADVTDLYGSSGIAIAVEKKPGGRIFGNSAYTEVVIGKEVIDEKEYEDLSFINVALRKLLYTYRFLTPDLRSRIHHSIGLGSRVIRTGKTSYVNEQEQSFFERLYKSIPQKWDVRIVKVDDFVSGVHSNSEKFGDINRRSEQVGSFLAAGFTIPKPLFDLEIVIENVFYQKNTRMGVFETMCLAELSIINAWKHFARFLKINQNPENDLHGWKFLSQKVLPQLLSLYHGDKVDILKRMSAAVTLRHNVVHKGLTPTLRDVDEVVSTVRALLTIIELPNRFKGDWHLKDGYPERQWKEISL